MFIKRGDGKIISVIDDNDLVELNKLVGMNIIYLVNKKNLSFPYLYS